jgi:hypothetical protein
MPEPQSIIAISIATVTEPTPRDGGEPVSHLVGVGLLHVTHTVADQFTYRLSARCIPAGVGEAVLIDWLTDNLPSGASVVGWQLADDIVPALLGAADEAPPDAARAFVDALALSVSRGAVDLADHHGGAVAPSFDQVCREFSIASAPIAPETLLAAWGIGRMGAIAEALGVNAAAAWRLAVAAMPERVPGDRFVASLLREWRRRARAGLASHDFRHMAAIHLTRSNDGEEEND